jgi:gliding motility-associated-like protein
MRKYSLIPVFLFLYLFRLSAQCNPPEADSCHIANVLCSLSELNGYTCRNKSTKPTGCRPLCSNSAAVHNTSWWAFVSQGGMASITMQVSNCATGQGFQWGIWGDCQCMEEIACGGPCLSQNRTETLTADLKPCKIYYFWIDGCSGDVCDFTLNVTGNGSTPFLNPIGFINNDTDRVINICNENCNKTFFVNPQPGGCEPFYVWTLDGKDVGLDTNEIGLNFPDTGTFTLCVTAYVGNPVSGSICSQLGPECTTIKVRKSGFLTNQLRVFCNEMFKNLNDTDCVYFADSTYRCQKIDSNCCKDIETGRYVVLDAPDTVDVIYLTCDSIPYVDINGKTYFPCQDSLIIHLPNSTDPFKCDSLIRLTANYLNTNVSFFEQCNSGFIELYYNVKITEPCSTQSYSRTHIWYPKNDPGNTKVGNPLIIDPVNEEYCIDIIISLQHGNYIGRCVKTFCESYNEGEYVLKYFPIAGDQVLCTGNKGFYNIDTFISQVISYKWVVKGGVIASKSDSSAIAVNWYLNPGDSGTVCTYFYTDCGRSGEQCLTVYAKPQTDAGKNDSICFFNYQLKGNSHSGKPNWKFIAGPGPSNIENPNSDVTNVNVSAVGTYTYEISEDYKGCLSKDTVEITFWDAPSFITPNQPECDSIAENYRIVVDVENGDQSSWKVIGYKTGGNILAGNFIDSNSWRSDWVHNNDSFLLIINDRHNCLPDSIRNSYECPCINKLGDLDTSMLRLCRDDIAHVNYNSNSDDPDGNDVIMFLLFDGNPLYPLTGNHIKFSSSGNFAYDPSTMQTGKTYYIAVFMGNVDPTDTSKILFNDRCLKYNVVPVTWYDYPVARIIGSDSLTCLTTTLVLVGTASLSGSGSIVSYLWSTVGGNIIGLPNTNSITINAPGDYKLLVTDSLSGCTNEVVLTINRYDTKPKVFIITPELLNCDRKTVVLDGSFSSQGNDFIVQWNGRGNISDINGYKPSVDSTGTYHLIITNINTGCKDSTSAYVGIDTIRPIPEIIPIGNLTCLNKQINLDGSNSHGKSGPLNFTWIAPDGSIISVNSTHITINKTGRYRMFIEDQGNGCDSVAFIDIVETANPLQGVKLEVHNPKCFGDANGSIEIKEVISTGPVVGLEYSLNSDPQGTNTSFQNLGRGSYQINIRDTNGCEYDTIITIQTPAKLEMSVIKTFVVEQGNLVKLDSFIIHVLGGTKNMSGEYADTSWYNLQPLTDWEPNLHYLADTTRDFLITVIDAAGCRIEEHIRIIVQIDKKIWWPSVFSPNGDNINDTWNLIGRNIQKIRLLNIYDRWGELVYSVQNLKDGNTDPSDGWNAEFKNQKALPGVYVFYAEVEFLGLTGITKYKGDFTLVR